MKCTRGNWKYGLPHICPYSNPFNSTPTWYTCFSLFRPYPTSHFLSQFTNICSPLNLTSDLYTVYMPPFNNICAVYIAAPFPTFSYRSLRALTSHISPSLAPGTPGFFSQYPYTPGLILANKFTCLYSSDSSYISARILPLWSVTHLKSPDIVPALRIYTTCARQFSHMKHKSGAYLFMCLLLSERTCLQWLRLQESVQEKLNTSEIASIASLVNSVVRDSRDYGAFSTYLQVLHLDKRFPVSFCG